MIDPDDETKTAMFSVELALDEEKNLVRVLQKNHDVFAWSHKDIPRVHPSIVEHQLSVNPSKNSVKQKICRIHQEKQAIILKEMESLLKENLIREVMYPKWIPNVVVVPKKRGRWSIILTLIRLS